MFNCIAKSFEGIASKGSHKFKVHGAQLLELAQFSDRGSASRHLSANLCLYQDSSTRGGNLARFGSPVPGVSVARANKGKNSHPLMGQKIVQLLKFLMILSDMKFTKCRVG